MLAEAARNLERAYRVVSPARKPAVPLQGRGRSRTPPRHRRRKSSSSVTAPPPGKEPTRPPVPFSAKLCIRLRDLALEAARLERRHRRCALESDVGEEDPSLELVRLRARCLSLEELIRVGRVGGGEPRSVALVTRAELARTYALGGMAAQALEHTAIALEQHSALASRDGYYTVEEEASSTPRTPTSPYSATKLDSVRAALRALSQLRDAFLRARYSDNTSAHPTARADDGDALVAGTAIYTELHALVAAYNHGGATSSAAELGALLRPSFAAVEMLRAPASALTWAGLAAHIRRWVPSFNALGQTLEDALWLHRTATLRCVFYDAATLEAQRAAASERETAGGGAKSAAAVPANVDSVGARIGVLRAVARADSEIATFLRPRAPPGAPPGGDRFAYDLGAALQDAGVTRMPWEDVLAWAIDGRVVSDALGALHAQMLLTAACARVALADERAAAAGGAAGAAAAGSRPARRRGAAARSSSSPGRAKHACAGGKEIERVTKKSGTKKSKAKSKGKSRGKKAKAVSTRRAAKAAAARAARDAELGEARVLLRDAEHALCGLIGVGAGDAARHLALCEVWASRGRAALAAGPAGRPAALECHQLIVDAKRCVLGDTHLETVRAQRALGELHALLGDDAAALDALDAALDARRGAANAAPSTALARRVFALRCAAIEASVAEADGDGGDGGNAVLAAPPTGALREAARGEWRAGDGASARSALWDAAAAVQRLDGGALGVHDAAAELLQLLVEYEEGVKLASAHEWLGSALIAAAEEQRAAGAGGESGPGRSFSTKGWSHLAKAKALFVDELGPGHASVRKLEERLATFQ